MVRSIAPHVLIANGAPRELSTKKGGKKDRREERETTNARGPCTLSLTYWKRPDHIGAPKKRAKEKKTGKRPALFLSVEGGVTAK